MSSCDSENSQAAASPSSAVQVTTDDQSAPQAILCLSPDRRRQLIRDLAQKGIFVNPGPALEGPVDPGLVWPDVAQEGTGPINPIPAGTGPGQPLQGPAKAKLSPGVEFVVGLTGQFVGAAIYGVALGFGAYLGRHLAKRWVP